MERSNEKGTIKINKLIFGRLAYDAVGLTEGRAFSASEKELVSISTTHFDATSP